MANSGLDWFERVAEVGDGIERRREATATDCARLARDWGIPDCLSLSVDYSISPLRRGRFRMTGTAVARVVQTCVVALEPFEQMLEEPIEVEFWPPEQLEQNKPIGAEVDVEALTGEDPEPIENGRMHVGGVVYQLLTSGLDPFPRGPDAHLERRESDSSEPGERDNPFSVLEKLQQARGGRTRDDQ